MKLSLANRVILRYGFSTNPKVTQRSLRKLDMALDKLVGSGLENDSAYYEALDGYRDIMYFLGRFLDPSDFQDAKASTPHLGLFVKYPLKPEDAVAAGGHAFFQKAKAEVQVLRDLLDEAAVFESYERDRK
jgi:hypothetical protein